MPKSLHGTLLPPLADNADALPILDGLTRRSAIRGILLVILVVSLLPLLALSTVQGIARIDRDRQAENRQLLEAAQLAGSADRNVIGGARALLGILAATPSVRSRVQDRCGPVLQQTVRGFPAYSHLGVSGIDGSFACASNPAAVGMPINNAALWQRLQRGGFLVTAPVWGRVSKRPVLRAILPLKTADGAFDGTITASIDLAGLRRLLGQQYARSNIIVALVDGQGRTIAGSQRLPWQPVKVMAANPAATSNTIFSVRSADGVRWSYAVAPLHIDAAGGESFHIIYASAQPARFGTDWWFAAGYFILPIMALILASAAIWYGANRAILRWVPSLGALARQIGNSAGPALHDRPDFSAAPSEIRALAAELLRMGNTIADRDYRLRQSVKAQTAVARELHHRVRNNLQVMGSFLSLQADGLPAGDARQALRDAQLRLATMAMVNNMLYVDAEVVDVSMAQLLDPIAELLARHTGFAGSVGIEPGLQPPAVGIDRAIPLALWIIEAAACLFERCDRTHGSCDFRIGIHEEDDVMCVAVTARGLSVDSQRASLHRRLVSAIAHQLSGRARIDDVGPAEGKIVLCLPPEKPADRT